jgi:FecR protein
MTSSIRALLRPGPSADFIRRPAIVLAGLARCARRVGLLLGLALALAGPPAAQGDDETQVLEGAEGTVLDSLALAAAHWVVLEATGAAAWRAEGEREWRPFTPGEVLPPGCEIETGPDGEVVLVAGGDQLTVAPLGRLIVPPAAPGQDRRLRHERGRILVHIESGRDRDVRVNTPLLSLGIKGTTFEIEVDPEQNSVVVHDGEVVVTPPGGQAPVELGAGQGLRQSTAPGSPATRFTGAPLETPASAVAAPSSIPDRAGDGEAAAIEERGDARPDLRMESDERGGAPSDIRTATDRRSSLSSSSPTKRPWGWIDDWASSWAWAAIAGVALPFLAIPVLVLVQILRERWRTRPGAQGRRRRELVRG